MSVSPSLLSLSFAAEAAEPIIIPSKLSHSRSPSASASSPASEPRPTREPSKRLSSTLATRRRLSDARDAALRPSPSSIIPPSTSVPNARGKMSVSPAVGSLMAGLTLSSSTGSNSSVGTVVREKDSKDKKEGKKGGVDHRCESCDKVYRHPSCLIKHRWEHTPQWRNFPSSTTTAFSPSTSAEGKYNKSGFISKHQQVQLLEAAAILSHLGGGKRGESLPEDRALWPGWVSGNAPLPGASRRVPVTASLGTDAVSSTNGAKGPRMYDFSVPSSAIPVQSSGTGVLTVPSRQTSVSYSDSLPSLGWSIPKSAVRGPSSGSGSGSDVEMEEPEDDEEEEDEEEFTGRYSKVSRAPQVEVWEEEMEMEM